LQQLILQRREAQMFGSAHKARTISDKAELEKVMLGCCCNRRRQGRETVRLQLAVSINEEQE
jgi:hypothetical protein